MSLMLHLGHDKPTSSKVGNVSQNVQNRHNNQRNESISAELLDRIL